MLVYMTLSLLVFQKLGHEIISQLKEQKKKGKSGPLKLQKVAQKKRRDGGGDSDEDEDRKFSNITAQLAWEKDIDLAKGQAFMKDEPVEKKMPRQSSSHQLIGNGGPPDRHPPPDRHMDEHTHIPNGSATRAIKRIVKKPNGTPRSSPILTKQFSLNRITPLPINDALEDSGVTDFSVDLEEGRANKQLSHTNRSSYSDLYGSVLSTRKSADFDAEPIVLKTNENYVNSVIAVRPAKIDTKHSLEVETSPKRSQSADSNAKYDQWVDEIIKGSPGGTPQQSPAKSDSPTSPGKHKTKKKKRDRSSSSKERKASREGKTREERGKSAGKDLKSKLRHLNKTPTSDDVLLADSDMNESVL